MTLRPRATEIPELVRRLGSRRQVLVDGARARLAIIGARAVEALVESLEGDSARIRLHAMPLLALIQDPRGREPLVAMLLDRDPRMREVAARSLARFPCRDTVAALERLLAGEKRPEVRMAAVQALIEHYATGQEQAIRDVLAVLADAAEDVRVRTTAMALLPSLGAHERRAILKRLRSDRAPEIAARAAEIEEGVEGRGERAPALRRLLAELASDDYAAWNESVHRLTALGAPVVAPLVEQMQRRSHDPEYCTRAGMVLRALGPRRARAIAGALETTDEPLPLQVLVEVVGALGDKSLIYGLAGLIERIGARRPVEANGVDPMQRVRAKAHLELARIGSRVAIEDLRAALADPGRRVELEMLAAVELIGKRDEIPDLLRSYAREDRFMKERIAAVVRTIMKRERLRRNNPLFTSMGEDTRRVLDTVLTPVAAARKATRSRRR